MLRQMTRLLLIPMIAITLLSACQPYDIIQSVAPSEQTDRNYVNNLPYSYQIAAPAQEAFRVVAFDRGWTKDNIEKWVPFVTNVMYGESGFCWNTRRGAKMDPNSDSCGLLRQGKYSDSGFGQVISIHYKYPNGWLCKQEHLCSSNDIISSPWNSMTALVALVERSGGSPWCFNKSARRYHNCGLVPR